MALKDDWKNTGKGLGGAFKELGLNVVRSVKTGFDKAEETMSNDPEKKTDSTVFNDGSWRKTGKDLGGAFTDLAHSIVKSAKTGVDKLDNKMEDSSEANSEESPEEATEEAEVSLPQASTEE